MPAFFDLNVACFTEGRMTDYRIGFETKLFTSVVYGVAAFLAALSAVSFCSRTASTCSTDSRLADHRVLDSLELRLPSTEPSPAVPYPRLHGTPTAVPASRR
jgi:hypothetical protein